MCHNNYYCLDFVVDGCIQCKLTGKLEEIRTAFVLHIGTAASMIIIQTLLPYCFIFSYLYPD